MSTSKLKELLHRRIDQLEDPQDIQDLFLTIHDFLGQRSLWQEESPEFLKQLEDTLESVLEGSATIPHEQVMQEAKQWITR